MSELEGPILLAQLASTLFMTGLIWFVQVVHYPLKSLVGSEAFVGYQAAHLQRTGWVVIIPMLTEAATALWLVLVPSANGRPLLLWISFFLLIKVWAITALYSVRAHQRLSVDFDPKAHHLLVGTNWIRTFGWSMRSILILWYVAPALQGGM